MGCSRHRRLYAERQAQPDAIRPAVPPHPAAAERHPLNCGDVGTAAKPLMQISRRWKACCWNSADNLAALQRHSVYRRRAAPRCSRVQRLYNADRDREGCPRKIARATLVFIGVDLPEEEI
ncbi:hypothetical protein M8494_25230 [Serratia ureilytica]